MSDTEHESVPENKKGFTIKASPLNPVKLELGAIIIIGVFLLLSVAYVVPSDSTQLLILFSYGLIAMVWLMVRVRRVLRSLPEENNG